MIKYSTIQFELKLKKYPVRLYVKFKSNQINKPKEKCSLFIFNPAECI